MTLRIPRILGIIALLVVSLGIVLLIIFINISPQNSPTTSDTKPTNSLPNRVPNTSQTKVKEVSPKEDLSGTTITNPSQSITYSLTQPLAPSQVRVTVSPYMPLKILSGDSPGTISVAPMPPEFWAPNVLYTIVISDLQGKVITSYNIRVPRAEFQEVVD